MGRKPVLNVNMTSVLLNRLRQIDDDPAGITDKLHLVAIR
jgi:hypothetical protein